MDDDIWKLREQEYTSAGTSINIAKAPAIFRLVDDRFGWDEGTINLDLGGGRYDTLTDALEARGVRNLIYDPYNRSTEHNQEVLDEVRDGGADTVTISNVLNVITEENIRLGILDQAYDALRPGGTVYITVYEGDGSGEERVTKSGFQLNRKLADYLDEVREVFPDAHTAGGMIVATK